MRTTESPDDQAVYTMVAGVGGAGCNSAARLIGRARHDLKIMCANTDAQALRSAPAHHRLQLGRSLTRGLGAGANPAIGRAAAQEALPEIVAALAGVKLCFVVAGLGGGTGSGAAPVFARAARELGILTIGIAIKPFLFEGKRRIRAADAAIQLMEDSFDALVVVCNENLLRMADSTTTFRQALVFSDSVVGDSILDLVAMIDGPALKRISIADLRSVLVPGGRTVIGHGGQCRGAGRAARAAQSALSNPLLDDVASGARHLLVTVSGGLDLGLFEIEQAVAQVQSMIHPEAELVWGSAIDPALNGVVRVGITAAGLPPRETPAKAARAIPSAQQSPSALQQVPLPFVASDMPAATSPTDSCAEPPHHLADARTDRDLAQQKDVDLRCPKPVQGGGRIYSRAQSPSLADRFHFATISLKHRFRREVRWIDQVAGSNMASIPLAVGKRSRRYGQPPAMLSKTIPDSGVAKS